MKLNYNKYKELNKETLVGNDGGTMGCFWAIQTGVERFLDNQNLSEEHKNLLIELGVLELSKRETASKDIVGPFKFNQDGIKETQ